MTKERKLKLIKEAIERAIENQQPVMFKNSRGLYRVVTGVQKITPTTIVLNTFGRSHTTCIGTATKEDYHVIQPLVLDAEKKTSLNRFDIFKNIWLEGIKYHSSFFTYGKYDPTTIGERSILNILFELYRKVGASREEQEELQVFFGTGSFSKDGKVVARQPESQLNTDTWEEFGKKFKKKYFENMF